MPSVVLDCLQYDQCTSESGPGGQLELAPRDEFPRHIDRTSSRSIAITVVVGRSPLKKFLRSRRYDGCSKTAGSMSESRDEINRKALARLDKALPEVLVTSAVRLPALPDIPVMNEFLPGFEANTWSGIGAPKNTPAGIIEKLNQEINATLADPKMKARIADLGADVLSGSPADFAKLIAADTQKWVNVIRAANIKF
jgi:tripartite-type tricarboxylate transporter receptor subunit TctC